MAATAQTPRNVKKKDRVVRLLACLPDRAAGFFRVTEKLSANRTKVDTYSFAEVECQIGGRGFVVEKLADADAHFATIETYHCRIDGDESTCECKGNLRWGHCRHVEGLNALIDARKIP